MGLLWSKYSSAWSSAEGKNVLITGASSGIGAEMARQFAANGASLALVARRRDKLEAVAKECRAAGAPVVEIYICDLSVNAQIKTMAEQAVAKFKGFDVVLLNAGRSQGNYFEEIKDVEQIDYLLKVNVSGVINTCHYLLPSIYKSRNSRLVVVSSSAGIVPVPCRSVYCATKHALTGFCNSLRMELQDTYKEECPAVCLINFPEVSGTELNENRLTFGADLPPFGWDGSLAIPVETACRNLYHEIALGTREWGHPLIISILRPFFSIFPTTLEGIIMRRIKKTHHRLTNTSSPQ